MISGSYRHVEQAVNTICIYNKNEDQLTEPKILHRYMQHSQYIDTHLFAN